MRSSSKDHEKEPQMPHDQKSIFRGKKKNCKQILKVSTYSPGLGICITKYNYKKSRPIFFSEKWKANNYLHIKIQINKNKI